MKNTLPPLVYEDMYVMVFNKPAGLMVHPDGKHTEPTLSEMVAEQFSFVGKVGEPMIIGGKEILRPGIVHRLDTETTGVLVVAKTQEAFLCLKQQFVDKEVTKIYHAFVYGHPKKEFGSIDAPIGRSAKDFRAYSSQRGARGDKREARTLYRVLSRCVDESLPNEWKRYSFVELRPKTGRTHQLRVHMKYMHHPIISDSLYAKENPPIAGFTRTALHARSITFKTPDGIEHTIEAPYPHDFQLALRNTHIHANL